MDKSTQMRQENLFKAAQNKVRMMQCLAQLVKLCVLAMLVCQNIVSTDFFFLSPITHLGLQFQ